MRLSDSSLLAAPAARDFGATLLMPMNNYNKIVVTIHGIRTTGGWQKEITPALASHGLIPYHINYGYFFTTRFFFKPFRERQIEAIRRELINLRKDTGVNRISIIAHSFGTFIAMEALRRDNGELKYDRVVLTGSILPRNFDWRTLFERELATAVFNVRATSDWVVSLAAFLSGSGGGRLARAAHWLTGLNAGDSGRRKFDFDGARLLDEEIEGHHSIAHDRVRFGKWARFISYPRLPDDLLRTLKRKLDALRLVAAKVLRAPADVIRINYFSLDRGVLKMVPGAFDNMTYAPEFELEIDLGQGSTGKAFTSGKPFFVIKNEAAWSGDQLPSSELHKLHPDLSWILSFPVKCPKRQIVVGVINYDRLGGVPEAFRDPESLEAQAVILALEPITLKSVGPCLEAGFLGEYLAEVSI